MALTPSMLVLQCIDETDAARRSGKKTHVKQEVVEAIDDVEYPARAILGEETRKGKVWYLIDWEDNPTTGEKYDPTWEPHSFATPDLKAEWQNKKLKERKVRKTASTAEVPGSPGDSPPIRPAKRRKLIRRGDIAEEEARGATIKQEPQPAFEGSQAISQEAGLERFDREIPDSYEEEGEQSTSRTARVDFHQARVEIGVPQDFDPGAYAVYNNSFSPSSEANPEASQGLDPEFSSDQFQSSQTSPILERSQGPELSSEPAQTSSAHQEQPRQVSQRAFIWDEDIEDESQPQTSETPKAGEVSSDPIQSSAPVPRPSQAPFIWDSDIDDEDLIDLEIETLEVPDSDSREPRGSSSYKPSETPPSKTETSVDSATRQNTQTNTEASLEAIEFRNSQWPSQSSASIPQDSGSIESQFAQRASFLDQQSYNETPEPTSAEVPQSQTQSTSGSSGNSATRPADTELPEAPAVEILSSPVLQSREPWSGAQLLSQRSPSKNSEESTSVGFLTQLPRVSCEEESGELPLLRDESDEGDRNIEDLDLNLQGEDSESVEKDSPIAQREQLSEPRSFSNFTDWQASKILSQSQNQTQISHSIRASSLPHSSYKRTQEDLIQTVSPQDENFPEPDLPASHLADSQKSTSSKSTGYSQTSSHLPSPPVEDPPTDDPIPTIEEAEPLDIKFSPEQPSSSPIRTPRRDFLSSSMEPSDDSMFTPKMDPTALLKAKMAAAKAARVSAAAISKSPTPALAHSNQSAVALNQALPIQIQVEPSAPQPPAIPNFDASNSMPPAPASESSIPAAISAAPVEERGPSPKATYPGPYPEEEEEEDESTTLKVMPLEPGVFEVPLPMTGYTRDIYVRRVKIYRVQLQSFLRDEVLDETLVAEVNSLLEALQTICIHPGLLDENPSQLEDRVMQAKWAENVSTKFIFLAELLELMQSTDKHVVILAQPGRILDELESLLLFHEIHYSLADQQRELSTSKFRVTIYPAGSQQYSVDPASVVIGFDPSYRSLPWLNALRKNSSLPEALAPVISLVVANSVEHIDRCFDDNLEAVGRLIKVINCAQQLSEKVGTVDEEGYLDPPFAARLVAEYLISEPREASWLLLPMPTIDGIQLNLMNSQTGSEEQPSYTMTLASQDLQAGAKRPLDMDESDDADLLKRQRLMPSNGELNNSHVSETVLRTSSVPLATRHTASSSEAERAQISSLLRRVSDLEAQLRAREATEMLLREINQDLESRCQDYEGSIAAIQPKYQQALNDRGEFEWENKQIIEREARLKKERDNKDAEVIKLRETNATIEAELSAAKTALATSAVPEITEFAKLKDDLANSRLETEKEHKRYLSANGDLEYLRTQFQTSSSSAAEHNNELRSLQEELASFRERSALDKVRIHEIQTSNENTELRQENTVLKARLKDLERDFEKKQEELKAVTNGRRATRGTSVPQSPRLGNQSSPGTRPSGRVLHGGSRGNSPGPGEARGPGGGAGPFSGGAFGDALFMNPPSQRERWGNHLQ
ncbi:hypothetical protein IFR05_007303 [Cadophora sp. M221]|nr:hypothetical protein IFR05_007303 [Cadophora sp. M221]